MANANQNETDFITELVASTTPQIVLTKKRNKPPPEKKRQFCEVSMSSTEHESISTNLGNDDTMDYMNKRLDILLQLWWEQYEPALKNIEKLDQIEQNRKSAKH